MSMLLREHLDSLGLADRRPPDLYLSSEDALGAPHAAAMRLAFEDLGLAGFLCVQGSPTVALLEQGSEDAGEVDRVQQALWNQGLASLLLVLRRPEILAYSLVRKPLVTGWRFGRRQTDPRLIEVLDLTARGLEAFHLITAVESGRYFTSHRSHFDRRSRVDAVLLGNLLETRNLLREEGLPGDQAQALLIQVTFIAYLEDRGFLDEASFEKAAGAGITSLSSLLDSEDPRLLERLFARLRRDFNGDVFLTPCSFDGTAGIENLTPRHLGLVAEFRRGRVEMETGQGRFWPYDFKYIPVELISALYDRFLAEDSQRQRASGAYYTPRALADLALDQIWPFLETARPAATDFRLLDPACGSGIFLVRAFQRLVEDLRHKSGERYPSWNSLAALVESLHGWDLEPGALRLAVFSLCVALLEEADPAEVKRRLRRGRLLPRLYGRTLQERDYFTEGASPERFDLVLGNPPWVSRSAEDTEEAQRWWDRSPGQEHGVNLPGGEIAWAFAWKTLEMVRPGGLIAFLLPAMGLLLNQNRNTIETRRMWLRKVRLHRVINLADLVFQLFEDADRPTALCLFSPADRNGANYKFDYWCPKADRHLQTTGVITLPSEDRMELHLSDVLADSGVWKRRMWMRSPEIKLYQWLGTFPRLGDKLATYRESIRPSFSKTRKPWVMGQGFQPASATEREDEDFQPKSSRLVAELPHLKSKDFTRWVLPDVSPKAFGDAPLRRVGFEDGYRGPRVLLLQGMERTTGRLQATFTKQSLTFRHSIQAIRSMAKERMVGSLDMKLLTAVLNSGLAAWFLFHEAANPGAERSKVHEHELLRLPFRSFNDLDSNTEQYRAAKKIVALMDEFLRVRTEALLDSGLETALERFDHLVYRYYGLSEEDITVVEDTLAYIIPSVQPRRKREPPLWNTSRPEDWRQHYDTLTKALGSWLSDGVTIGGQITGYSEDLVMLRLWLGEPLPKPRFIADSGQQLRQVLARLSETLPQRESRNLHLSPNLRVFLDDELFLVKPRAMRFWLRSTALDDADSIAGHLFARAQESRLADLTA